MKIYSKPFIQVTEVNATSVICVSCAFGIQNLVESDNDPWSMVK